MSPVSSVFNTEATVIIGLKNHTQSGNIHSIILDVHAEKQRAQNSPLYNNNNSKIKLLTFILGNKEG